MKRAVIVHIVCVVSGVCGVEGDGRIVCVVRVEGDVSGVCVVRVMCTLCVW